MKEHKIPIQLSRYAHFIVGSSRDILEITVDPKSGLSQSNSLSFLNCNIDTKNSEKQLLASISLSDLQSIFPIKSIHSNLNINISISFPSLDLIEKNKFIPIENSFEIINFEKIINDYENQIKKIYMNSNYEFCPINLKDETDFYYGYFLDNLNNYERNIFISSNKFTPKINKIGGFNLFPNISLYENTEFDFSEPLIPLLLLDNKLLGLESNLSLAFFIKEPFFNNWQEEKILSFICVS